MLSLVKGDIHWQIESANWPYFILTCTYFELTLFTIPAIFYMCFRIEMDKSNVTWFLRGQTSDKICLCKKSQLKLFILLKWDDELIVM